jgi:hypothetical protein
MLLVTLLVMGVPSMVIGIIPSYQSIGYWAAASLLAVGKGDPHYVVAYMIALGIIAVFCALLMRQRET